MGVTMTRREHKKQAPATIASACTVGLRTTATMFMAGLPAHRGASIALSASGVSIAPEPETVKPLWRTSALRFAYAYLLCRYANS